MAIYDSVLAVIGYIRVNCLLLFADDITFADTYFSKLALKYLSSIIQNLDHSVIFPVGTCSPKNTVF